jgi:hypothetical protein
MAAEILLERKVSGNASAPVRVVVTTLSSSEGKVHISFVAAIGEALFPREF